jgi:23S rRNA-/tRNA-specific pseudouridylate synthase
MVTFYESVHSLEYSKDNGWVPFVNKETEKEKEAYHLVRFELETGKKH